MNCSLIIPAYNEEQRLSSTLHQYAAALRARFGTQFEILVIANGCTDGTAAIARRMATQYLEIAVVEIPDRVGKGGALLAGFQIARGARIAYTDADGSVEPASLLALCERLANVDIAIGSRHLDSSAIGQAQPLTRRLAGTAFRVTVRRLFGLPYRDTQCGAKALRREAARTLATLVTERGWAFDVELLLAAGAEGFTIGEYPVTWSDVVGSRLRFLPTLIELGKAFARMHKRWGLDAPDVSSDAGSAETRVDDRRLKILAFNWRCLRHPQAGGSEVNIFEQAMRWSAIGHEVTIFCADPGPERPGQQPFDDGKLTVIRRGNKLTVYLHAAVFMLTQGHRYDRVLEVMNGVPFFAPLFTNTPTTLLIHHVMAKQWFIEAPGPVATIGWLIESKVAPLLYRNHPVITVSPTSRDELIKLGYRPEQLQVVYNGIGTSARRATPLLNDGGTDERIGPPRIVYLGRLRRYKRLELLIRAAVILKRERPDLLLDIAGEGEHYAEIAGLIAALDARDWITLHGAVDEVMKETLLASGTVFASPSMNEGWGLTVLEANLQGCPAVAYAVPGLSVAIRDGVTGLLATDDSEFVRALAFFLDRPEERRRFAIRARAWAESFNWETCARETLDIVRTGIRQQAESVEAINFDALA